MRDRLTELTRAGVLSLTGDQIAVFDSIAQHEAGDRSGRVPTGDGDRSDLSDATAQAWLLGVYKDRPAFVAKVIERVREEPARGRLERLDALSSAIIETYVAEEPLLHYHKATRGKQLAPEQDAELLAKLRSIYEPIGRRKGRRIVAIREITS